MLSEAMDGQGMFKAVYHGSLTDGEHLGQPLPLQIARAYGRSEDEIFSNARLISKAPNLLTALRWFVNHEDECPGDRPDILDIAKALIAEIEQPLGAHTPGEAEPLIEELRR